MQKTSVLITVLLFSTPPFLSQSSIHVFGDSHASCCFADGFERNYVYKYNTTEINFYIHWLGARTMHRIGRDGLNAINLKDYIEYKAINNEKVAIHGIAVQDNDVVIFVFGEIDVRNHIGRQRNIYGHSIDSIIDILVKNYLRTITINRQLFDSLTCMVMGIIPPAYHMRINTLPIYGSIHDRVTINKQLNIRLETACKERDILFLPTNDLYALPDGSLDPTMSDGMVHIAKTYNYLIRNRLIALLEDEKII